MNLDLDSASLLEEADKSKVPPILQKRIITFVNHFILKTCTFLNDFVEECEIRFIETERKMQKLEATLIILEEKLASIPDIADHKETTSTVVNVEENKENILAEENATIDSKEPPDNPGDNKDKGIKANEDARYKKFFKMLQFGVPPQAIKRKMEIESLNSNILDTPNLILTDGIPCAQETDS